MADTDIRVFSAAGSKLEWLQILRGVAALLVLYFHMEPHWNAVPALASFSKAMHFGFFGVDLFFVLSGFVVFLSSEKCINAAQIKNFLRRRVLRIYLGYWPVLAVFAVLPAVLHSSIDRTNEQIVKSILLLYPNGAENWLPTAWSLTYELYFYICLAAICLFAGARRLQILTWIGVGVVLWNSYWLIFQPEIIKVGEQPFHFALSAYGIEFIAGAVISEISKSWKRQLPFAGIFLPIGLSIALIAFSIGTTWGYFDHIDFMRLGTFGIAAIAILCLTLYIQFSNLGAPRWLVAIGDASFSLYLIHPYLLDQMGKARYKYFNDGPQLYLVLYSLIFPWLIVAISLFWFRTIERPLINFATNSRNVAKNTPD